MKGLVLSAAVASLFAVAAAQAQVSVTGVGTRNVTVNAGGNFKNGSGALQAGGVVGSALAGSGNTHATQWNVGVLGNGSRFGLATGEGTSASPYTYLIGGPGSATSQTVASSGFAGSSCFDAATFQSLCTLTFAPSTLRVNNAHVDALVDGISSLVGANVGYIANRATNAATQVAAYNTVDYNHRDLGAASASAQGGDVTEAWTGADGFITEIKRIRPDVAAIRSVGTFSLDDRGSFVHHLLSTSTALTSMGYTSASKDVTSGVITVSGSIVTKGEAIVVVPGLD